MHATMCEMHYGRVRRNGTTSALPRRKRQACTMDGCLGPARNKGLCGVHAERVRRHGDPTVLLYRVGDTGPLHPCWRGEDITYSSAHSRTRAVRGQAHLHPCVDCGGPAAQWSYDHNDQGQIESVNGPYSVDPQRYEPRCVPCHKRFDLGRTYVRCI